VFGRPAAAEARQLAVVAGGPAAAVDACRPLFAALGRAVHLVSDAPQASLAKLVGNYFIAATTQALGEALALAEKGGIDPERMLAVLVGSGFGSPIVERYGALVARTEFAPGAFPVRLGLKDVGLALAAGTELRVPLPIAGLARDRLLSAMAHGWGEHDFAALAGVIRVAAGLPARRDAYAAAEGSPS
jgi:3-hydroxyisobutyrate dehydrogenase-like beta-hydroxyacid dehydrogenase